MKTIIRLMMTIVIIATTQLSNPTPATSKTVEQKQMSPKNGNSDSVKNNTYNKTETPITNNTITSQVSSQKTPATNKKDYEEINANTNMRIADITRWIMIFTGLNLLALFGQTVILIITISATRKAADAAKKSADALPMIERAYVFVDIDWQNYLNVSVNTPINARVRFKNHGNTPAIIRQVHARLEVVNDYPTIIYDDSSKIPKGIIISSKEDTSIDCVIVDASIEEQRDILNGKKKLICYGRIIYEDILKEERMTVFCWEYNTVFKSLYISSNEKLNGYT
jgi:hypothetical protein